MADTITWQIAAISDKGSTPPSPPPHPRHTLAVIVSSHIPRCSGAGPWPCPGTTWDMRWNYHNGGGGSLSLIAAISQVIVSAIVIEG